MDAISDIPNTAVPLRVWNDVGSPWVSEQAEVGEHRTHYRTDSIPGLAVPTATVDVETLLPRPGIGFFGTICGNAQVGCLHGRGGGGHCRATFGCFEG